jgi:hypothetical protein
MKQKRDANSAVFLDPVLIKGVGPFSQFGLSISKLGNVDGDANKYQDFAVGAPFAEGGGAVFIFHGAAHGDFQTQPVQVISTFCGANHGVCR